MTQSEPWKVTVQNYEAENRRVKAADTVLSALDLLVTEYGGSKDKQFEAAFMAEIRTLALDLAIKRFQR